HFPVPQANPEQAATLANYATNRAQLTANLQTLNSKFTRSINRRFPILSTREHAPLSNFLSYAEFIAGLGKKKIKLSLSEEAEWEDYFVQESKKALELKTAIDTTDREIDRMVYALYGLSDEEIKIVEQA
ncbi:restriction endonuclease subunit M, partial [bacterium]|nr:restriction endonuclease subunit M [bacterium]